MKMVRWADGVKPLLVPIDSVRQHPDNPNNGDVDAIVESIQINGFFTAITADKDTGYILAGNHRYQALHALGATEIPVIWTQQDPTSSTRILIADNRLGQMAQMDNAALAELLQDLQETETGLAGSGYDDGSLEALLAQVALDQEAEIGEGEGFGSGEAPNGIYQVIVDFYDEDERDNLFASLVEDHSLEGKVRTANL